MSRPPLDCSDLQKRIEARRVAREKARADKEKDLSEKPKPPADPPQKPKKVEPETSAVDEVPPSFWEFFGFGKD
jgi:hypothetical protein